MKLEELGYNGQIDKPRMEQKSDGFDIGRFVAEPTDA